MHPQFYLGAMGSTPMRLRRHSEFNGTGESSSTIRKDEIMNQHRWLTLGIAIGAGVGTVFGVLIGSIALGIALGVGVGVALGTGFDYSRRPR